jgi:hypothetical protein
MQINGRMHQIRMCLMYDPRPKLSGSGGGGGGDRGGRGGRGSNREIANSGFVHLP